MWEKICAAVSAFLVALVPFLEKLAAAWGGAKLQQGADAKQALDDVERAVAASPGATHPERVRYLKQRGLYRLQKPPSDGG